MTNITPIVVSVIAVILAVLTYIVIPFIESKISAQDREDLLRWVEIGVAAAQQLYYAADGSKRKQYVLEFLESKGYDVNTDEIDNALEAAVLKLHKELSA